MHKEEIILDKALEIYSNSGLKEAYDFLVNHFGTTDKPSSQYYNFLYCLAATTGQKNESLSWLHQAIVDNGFWYRPEIFEDTDLDSIRDEPVFEKLKELSDSRYKNAMYQSETVCTFKKVEKKKLALVLHGNQQNISSDGGYWYYLELDGYQVVYVQSKTIDSVGLYRWEENESTQLNEVLASLPLGAYEEIALCGFSAGCNEILRTMINCQFKPTRVIFVAPWLPIFDKDENKVQEALEEVEIAITCGDLDEDCLPLSQKLAAITGGTFTLLSHHGHRLPLQIITDRLFLRSFNCSDLNDYVEIMANHQVTKYLGDGSKRSTKQIEKLMTQWQANFYKGTPVFAVVEKDSRQLIGHCGLAPLADGRTEILYAFAPSAWGKGYATEAGQAVIDLAKEMLFLDEIMALSYPENKASRKVIEKMNFKYVGQEEYFNQQLDVFSLKI